MSPSEVEQGGELPIDDVLSMREKGYDNNQIIEELQDKGYSSSDIFDALNQADMEAIEDEPDGEPAPQGGAPAQGQQQVQAGQESAGMSNEELIEEIIEEKWHALMDKLQVVIDWKEKSERRLSDLEQDVESLRDSVEQVQKSVGDRLEAYDGTMKDVQKDVKAMEQTFSDALPAFTENVSKMEALVQSMEEATVPEETSGSSSTRVVTEDETEKAEGAEEAKESSETTAAD